MCLCSVLLVRWLGKLKQCYYLTLILFINFSELGGQMVKLWSLACKFDLDQIECKLL